jgi:hypothetical protein
MRSGFGRLFGSTSGFLFGPHGPNPSQVLGGHAEFPESGSDVAALEEAPDLELFEQVENRDSKRCLQCLGYTTSRTRDELAVNDELTGGRPRGILPHLLQSIPDRLRENGIGRVLSVGHDGTPFCCRTGTIQKKYAVARDESQRIEENLVGLESDSVLKIKKRPRLRWSPPSSVERSAAPSEATTPVIARVVVAIIAGRLPCSRIEVPAGIAHAPRGESRSPSGRLAARLGHMRHVGDFFLLRITEVEASANPMTGPAMLALRFFAARFPADIGRRRFRRLQGTACGRMRTSLAFCRLSRSCCSRHSNSPMNESPRHSCGPHA